MTDQRTAEVLILGAGFAGLTAARRLAAGRDVLVVDRNNYQTLRPKLPGAVGGTCACTARLPVADALGGSRAAFMAAEVRAIDPEAHSVETSEGRIGYGRLLVALGSRPNLPASVPGAAEMALPLWDFDHACDIRRRVTLLARAASRAATASERQRLTSVVVVGGGFVGAEAAGYLRDRLAELGRAFGLPPGEGQIDLVEQSTRLLPGFGPALGAAAQRDLVRRGVHIHLGTAVRAVVPDGVILADGTAIQAGTVIWAGGARAVEPVAALGASAAGGRIMVRGNLQATSWAGVYAAGDAAAVAQPGGGVLPQSAQLAMQAGVAAADSIARDLAGLPPRAYRLHERGVALELGARAARAQLGPVRVSNWPVRLLKGTVLARYLFTMGGMRLLAAYFDPVLLQPLRGRIELANPPVDLQRADPRPRVAAP